MRTPQPLQVGHAFDGRLAEDHDRAVDHCSDHPQVAVQRHLFDMIPEVRVVDRARQVLGAVEKARRVEDGEFRRGGDQEGCRRDEGLDSAVQHAVDRLGDCAQRARGMDVEG
ncbi:MAG: hypothetical protein O3A96_04570, partial [Proteobacteria bacterium]|nr:hypothetical protein [Pseudomonadota bacterium]